MTDDKELTKEEARQRISQVTGGAIPDPNPADYARFRDKQLFLMNLEVKSLMLIARAVVLAGLLIAGGAAGANHFIFHWWWF